MNTGQTVYEQLQKMLEILVVLGWSHGFIYKGYNYKCTSFGVWNGEEYNDSKDISYHELFSKDSGLMEFVEWKVRDGISNKRRRNTIILLQYRSMSSLTAEEKIEYFVKNARVPTK